MSIYRFFEIVLRSLRGCFFPTCRIHTITSPPHRRSEQSRDENRITNFHLNPLVFSKNSRGPRLEIFGFTSPGRDNTKPSKICYSKRRRLLTACTSALNCSIQKSTLNCIADLPSPLKRSIAISTSLLYTSSIITRGIVKRVSYSSDKANSNYQCPNPSLDLEAAAPQKADLNGAVK